MKNCRLTDRKGFTLIEVIVVAAIIATLAGIMVPFIYKVWESTEIDTTRERITDLKKAIVGDPKLLQNGVRTHFGFVGDIGALPTASNLQELLEKPAWVNSNWNGPYLPRGFDPSGYKNDAWGNSISYSPITGVPEELMELRSIGADRTTGTADDIVMKIYTNEVFPTQNMPADVLQGNLSITFNSAPSGTLSYSSKICARYRDGTGNLVASPVCVCTPVSIPGDGTRLYFPVPYNVNIGVSMPIGSVYLSATLYSALLCPAPNLIAGQTNPEIIVKINDRISSIFADLQMQSIP